MVDADARPVTGGVRHAIHAPCRPAALRHGRSRLEFRAPRRVRGARAQSGGDLQREGGAAARPRAAGHRPAEPGRDGAGIDGDEPLCGHRPRHGGEPLRGAGDGRRAGRREWRGVRGVSAGADAGGAGPHPERRGGGGAVGRRAAVRHPVRRWHPGRYRRRLAGTGAARPRAARGGEDVPPGGDPAGRAVGRRPAAGARHRRGRPRRGAVLHGGGRARPVPGRRGLAGAGAHPHRPDQLSAEHGAPLHDRARRGARPDRGDRRGGTSRAGAHARGAAPAGG